MDCRSIACLTILGGLAGCGAPRVPLSAPFAATVRCTGAPYGALDFWLGDWDVAGPDGAPEGTNHIAATLDRCGVEERWADADGTRGASLFYVDRARQRWKQVWVTSDGGWKEKEQRDDGPPGSTRFQGEVARPGGGAALDRTTLTPLPDGRVRQVIEQSIDQGTTWRRWEGLYSRRAVASACAGAGHRQLDFWLGDWDLVVKARKSPTSEEWVEARGRNRVVSSLSGCSVEESFEADGPGARWAGHSASSYDDAGSGWRQTWVDDSGAYLTFAGGWRDREMVLSTPPQTQGDVTRQMRMVFTRITRDALLWRWEGTRDGGRTWRPAMLIEYRRHGT